MRPVFVIGSEVPIPGGATEAEDTLAVTKPEAFRDTVSTYQRVWAEEGVGDGMADVIAVVVQPGVEFGDEQVFDYNPAAAVDLCAALKEFPGICFEGHSTDYQTAQDLYNMVTDGIAILKVGPALTYGLREALFSLSMMEKELVPAEKRANFIETLEEVMLANPGNWNKHYHGDEAHLALCRKYTYSDRARYYIGQPQVAGYSSAKAGYLGLIHTLTAELAEYGITVNAIAPGWIDTPMFRKATDNDQPRLAKIMGRIPAKRVGDPMDVGMCAAFLCSNAARYISGACIPVDGGALIGF